MEVTKDLVHSKYKGANKYFSFGIWFYSKRSDDTSNDFGADSIALVKTIAKGFLVIPLRI